MKDARFAIRIKRAKRSSKKHTGMTWWELEEVQKAYEEACRFLAEIAAVVLLYYY